MTTNKLMTAEQLDELLAVAVRMQRDAEVDRNLHSANFAYAVQVAVLELCKVRTDFVALTAENAVLKHAMAPNPWAGIGLDKSTGGLQRNLKEKIVDKLRKRNRL